MRNIALASLIIALAVPSIACGPPRLDLRTVETAEESGKRIEAALSEDAATEYRKAVTKMLLTSITPEMIFGTGPESGEDIDKRMDEELAKIAQNLHGKSAKEIIAEAERATKKLEQIKAEREQREKELERQQALVEIARLTEQINQAEKTQARLDQFEILESRVYKPEGMFTFQEVGIYLKVKNNLDVAVKAVYTESRLTSPGRSVPWVEEQINYEPPSGVDTGETDEWRLDPGYGSDFPKIELKDDMILTVRPVALELADGTEIGPIPDIDESIERLEALRKAYGEAGNGESAQ